MRATRKLGRQMAFGVFAQLLVSGRGLVMMPIIVKLAGDGVFGSYVLISSILVFIGGISSFGTNYHYRRALPSMPRTSDRRHILMPQLTFRAGTTVLFCALLCPTTSLLPGFFGTESFSLIYVFLWLSGIAGHEQATDYFRYTGRINTYNVLIITQIYLQIAVLLILYAVTGTVSLDDLLLSQALSLWGLALPVLLLGVFRETGIEVPRFNRAGFWKNAKLGLPLTGEFVVDFLVAFADRYLIGVFLSVAAVGHYQASYALAGLLAFLPKVMSTVLPPLQCRLWDEGREEEVGIFTGQAFRVLSIFSVPFVTGAFLAGPQVVRLLTNEEVAFAGRWVTGLVATGMFFYGVLILVSGVGFVVRRTRVILASNAIAVAVNFLVNILLLPEVPSITVPACASAVGYAVAAAYALQKINRTVKAALPGATLAKAAIASTVMAVVLLKAGYWPGTVGETSAMLLALHIAFSVIVYFATFIMIGGLSRRDREYLKEVIKNSAG